MPSTYTSNLGIELPADGEQDGVWGDVVNDNMNILDRAINGSVLLSLSGTSSTLTTSDGTLSNGQYKALILGGSPSGTHTITIAPNDAQKIYFVYNLSGQSAVFTQGSGTNVTIANGDTGVIYSDGGGGAAGVVNLTDNFAMNSVKITGGTITGITDLAVADGGTGASSAADARTNLGLVIGTNVQAYDAELSAIAALAVTDSNFIVGNGTTWVAESGATARTSLGLGSIATQASNSVSITGGSITGITDLAVADGGTGASDAAGARTNLGLGTMATQASSSVSITGGSITGITDLAIADGGTGASTAAQALINLGLTATAAELNFVDGVTSAIQTQLDGKPANNGTGASGTWAISISGNAATATTSTTLTGLTSSVAELNFVDGVTSAIQTQIDAKSNTASPTFTGTVGLPAATVSDGVTTTADNDGTISSGTYTPTPSGGNMKRIVNGGAFTLAAPTASGDYTLVIQITNNASAGAITMSGFNRTTGSFTTTNGHDFFVYITKCNGFTFANTVALQ